MNEHRVSQLIDEARYFIDHGMWLHAVQPYRQLIDAFPDESGFYLDLATVYMEMGNLDAAEQTLLRALRHDPGNPDIIYALGIAFFRAGTPDKALTYLEQLIGRRLPKVHNTMGIIYHQKGDLHSAERQFRLVLEMDPEYPSARISLGKVLLQLHEPDRALPVLENELARRPEAVDVQTLLGLTHSMAARWPSALEVFERIIGEHPNEVRALLGAANAYIHMRDAAGAAPLLERALALDPVSADVHMHLGLLAMLRSDRKRATGHFSRALEIEPDNHDALQHLKLLRADDVPAK